MHQSHSEYELLLLSCSKQGCPILMISGREMAGETQVRRITDPNASLSILLHEVCYLRACCRRIVSREDVALCILYGQQWDEIGRFSIL